MIFAFHLMPNSLLKLKIAKHPANERILLTEKLSTKHQPLPRAGLKKQKISIDLIEELSNFLTIKIQILCKRRKLAMSLTSGIDSRLTLVAIKGFKDFFSTPLQ